MSQSKIVPLIMGIIVVAAIGIGMTAYSGILTGRWGAFSGFDEARKTLLELPTEIGDWIVDAEMPLSKEDVQILQIQDSYIARQYSNRRTGEQVHLVIMLGPSGRVVVHTPEICFGGKNFEKENNRTSEAFSVTLFDKKGTVDDSFWKVDFINRAIRGQQISFYYGVSAGEQWAALDNPRTTFRTKRYVYKLQAQALVNGDSDVVHTFLEDVLPVIHKHLKPCL
ncbi:MAG: exosortase-associated EpsI family protein [Thermoguttaceae bacterium]